MQGRAPGDWLVEVQAIEISVPGGNNKSQRVRHRSSFLMFLEFKQKHEKKKTEANKEQKKEFSFITVHICCLSWASFKAQ